MEFNTNARPFEDEVVYFFTSQTRQLSWKEKSFSYDAEKNICSTNFCTFQHWNVFVPN